MSYGHDGHSVIWPYEWRALTPAQKGTLTGRLIRRPRTARAQAIGRLLLRWARFLRRQRIIRDLRELAAMDDLMLEDVVVSRSEVRSAMESGCDLKRGR